MVKNPPANARDMGSSPRLEKEMATQFRILAWRIPQTRGSWWATVHGVTKSWTWLSTQHSFSLEGPRSYCFQKAGYILNTFALWNLEKLLVAQTKNLPAMRETWVGSLGWEDPLEEAMATHSSILAWRTPWTEEPGGLQSTGLQSRTRLSLAKHCTL